MSKRSLFVFFAFVIVGSFPQPLVAIESYLWPLQENFGISATFGESREDHFHAGIDISTNGETGLPVLAVADGQIYRLKVQKRAYGRALYIQHAGGIQSVYAHLESYSNDFGLEKLYQDKVTETGNRYLGDIFVEPPIPVKKGDVVAFSGETGAGLPHLHLELRKNETEVLNPLTNGFQDTLDPVPPTFQSCYLYPLTPESAVNGNLETKEIRLKKLASDYAANEIPVVRGDFIASVSVYDSALRPYHRAPHKITYSIDDRILYSLEFNQFSYSQPQAFGLVYDLGKPGPSYYEYPVILSKLVDFSQPFVSSAIPFYTKALSPGLHRLRIEASDSNNNTSLAKIDFIVNEPPILELEDIKIDEKNLVATALVSDPNWKVAASRSIAAEVEYSADEGKTFHPFSKISLVPQMDPGSMRFTSSASLAQFGKLPTRLIVKARGYDGMEYSSDIVRAVQLRISPVHKASSQIPKGTLRYLPSGSAIRVFLDTNEMLTYPIQVSAGNPPLSYTLHAHGLTSYQATIPAPKIRGPWTVRLDEKQSIDVPVEFVAKGSPARVEGENYQLNFSPDTLFWDTFIWTKSLPAYQAPLLPFMGPFLQLGPRGLPLKNRAVLSFSYPNTVKHTERLSIYNWDRAKQKWMSLPSSVDIASKSVQTKISYFDLYALMYDNVPPSISNIFPRRRSSTTNPTPKLAATIQDRGMDVDDEKVTFYVDGTAYRAEYDPDRNVATAKITTPLRKGYHRFWAVAYDYAGNRTQSTKVTFRVR